MRLLLAPLLAVLLLAAPLSAQVIEDVEVGGGEDINVPVLPGLGPATPVEGEINPEDVPLFRAAEDRISGRVTLPDDKLGTLIQPEGRQWRAFRIQGVFWTMTAAILITVAALAGFYFWKGTIRIESGRAGRWIRRFGTFERFAHWLTAVSFLVLALTGLILVFGRTLLIPVIGHWAYTPLADVSKYLHNWSGVPFVLGLVLMLVLWVRDNLPQMSDITWFRQAGGMFSGPGTPHLETGRFNAGQKVVFWSVILFGGALAATGYLLMMPFFFTGVSGMQIFHVIHALLAVAMVSVILVHIYIGTIGMEGAFDAMGRGEVDENWAKEHHSGWYKEETSGQTETAGRSPAE
jgi:formate dehydrogenase subunit gamma